MPIILPDGCRLSARVWIPTNAGQRPVPAILESQVNLWKRELLTGASTLFKKGQQKQAEDHEAEKDRLYNQIGRLKVEVDWLQKKWGI